MSVGIKYVLANAKTVVSDGKLVEEFQSGDQEPSCRAMMRRGK